MRPPSHVPDLEQTRLAFLEEAADYAYGLDPESFHKTIETEYPSLHSTTYLDHAASTPPPRSTLVNFADKASNVLYSNPHSRSSSSSATSLEIERCRARILEELFGLVDPSDWDLVFTSGATAALKMAGETFPWHAGARYAYLKQSHTSLVGVRGCAMARGAVVSALDAHEMLELPQKAGVDSTLFAYPAQCNATGSRLGLEYSRLLKEKHPDAFILLDASAYLSTAVLDLASIPLHSAPDFIACSFYKIVGYPTGLGCLVVKRASGAILQRNGYFGGGTIDAISVSSPFWSHPRRSKIPGPLHERFEDGTLPFLNIIALNCALETYRKLFKSHNHISRHVSALLQFATREMASIRHANGRPVIRQHRAFGSLGNLEEPGGIIGFSVLDPASEYVGHVTVEQLATVNGFHIRTGGLCNTGVVLASAFNISDEEILDEYDRGRSCWDDEEFGGAEKGVQYPLGMVRISFGASSTIDDILQWLSFIRRYFVVSDKVITLTKPVVAPSASLKAMMLYPIKSCGGQSLSQNESWVVINTCRYPRMALIRPAVVLKDQLLLHLRLPLNAPEEKLSEATICSDVVPVSSSSTNLGVDDWFTEFLGVQCTLRRVSGGARRHAHFDRATGAVPILLSNESPFLLISQSSVDQVNDWIHAESHPSVHADCFRANFVLTIPDTDPAAGPASLPPFAEDNETFQVLARCRRCLMVCVDQSTGCRTKEPFSCLARNRKSPRGRIEFGVHLMWRQDLSLDSSSRSVVRVGDAVTFVPNNYDGL
ncbi:molybdenum cofactor sulfurase [Mycena amicta]|nr:molybdenum cofactor sulfurase [Mycena amicta]